MHACIAACVCSSSGRIQVSLAPVPYTATACVSPAAKECGRRCMQCLDATDPEAKDADGNSCADKCEECAPFIGCLGKYDDGKDDEGEDDDGEQWD